MKIISLTVVTAALLVATVAAAGRGDVPGKDGGVTYSAGDGGKVVQSAGDGGKAVELMTDGGK